MKRELENETNDVAVEEAKKNYSCQNSSTSKMIPHNVPNGLVFLLLRNSKGIFFLPSSKNYYDGIEMEKVQIKTEQNGFGKIFTDKRFIWVSLIVVILLLGFVTFRMMKDIK